LTEGISQSGRQAGSQSVSQSVSQAVSQSVSQAVSQSVRQSVSQKKIPLHSFFFKFRGNFLKIFQVNLKAQFYLTNTIPVSFKKIEAGFRVILLHGPHLLLGRPNYEPLLWFMIIFNLLVCLVFFS